MVSLFNQYRPYSWDQFKGQDIPITYLRNRVASGSHPNAILLQGSPGVGKSSLAFLYAKSVLDPDRNKGDDCVSSEEAYKKDYCNIIYHLVRDSSSTKESLDSLISLAMSKPIGWEGMREDQYRRFIILDEVELLHSTTFSYLLNPLEYSPSTTTWILISMDSSKLNPVVRSAIESRCKELKLNPLKTSDIASLITDNVEDIDLDLALFIAKSSNGNARKAWSLLEVLEGASALTLDKAESYLLNSAISKNRKLFIEYILNKEINKAIKICNGWSREIAGEALIRDVVALKDKSLIPLLKELMLWINSPHPYPLEAVVLSLFDNEGSTCKEKDLSIEHWLNNALNK